MLKRRATSHTAAGARLHRIAAVPALVLPIAYVGLLLVIPTRLVFAPLGSVGTPANMWALGCAATWVCLALGGLIRERSLPTRIGIGLLMLAVVASYVAGMSQGWYQPADIHQRSDRSWQWVSQEQLNEIIVSAADRGFLAMVAWAGVALITAESLRNWAELERLTTWIVRFAGLVAALGVFQYFTGWNVAALIQVPGLSNLSEFNVYSRSELVRVVGTSAHPIELGVVMASILPLALHHSLHSAKRTAWIPTGLIGAVVLMSVSRSAIVVSAVALVILVLGWPPAWRLRALLIAPLALLAGRIVLPGLLGTIRSLFTGIEADPSILGRTDDYDLVLRMVLERPFVGRGLFTWVPQYFRTIDNQLLVLLLEVGVVGTVLFIAMIATGVIMAMRARRLSTSPARRHLGLATAASIGGITLSYITFDALGFRQVAGLTFLLLGMAGAALRLAKRELDAPPSRATSADASAPAPPLVSTEPAPTPRPG